MSEGQKYTPKVFSALKNQVLQQAETEVWCIPQMLVFKGKKKNTLHQRAFLVFVRDVVTQYWCIDLSILKRGRRDLRGQEQKKGHNNLRHFTTIFDIFATCLSPCRCDQKRLKLS